MDYWRGGMDWYTEPDWACWACGCGAMWLEWGLAHGQCRCSRCGVHYAMRDENGNRVTAPIVMTNESYIEPFKRIWETYGRHIDDVSDTMWKRYGVE